MDKKKRDDQSETEHEDQPLRIPERKTGDGITPRGTSASLPVDQTIDASPDEGGGHERHPVRDVNGDELPGAEENNLDEDVRR
jgi:hypothetical protein